MANTIKVSILGDVKDISRKLGDVDSKLGGFGKKISGIGKMVAGAFAGVAVGAFFKDIVSSASNAQQSLGATEAIFGQFADTVIRTSDEAATKFGLSANDYRENANQLGAVLGNLGVSQDQLAGKTEGLIGLGSDLSAMFGGTTKSAVEALTAAYKGEYEQMERYGVSIKAADVSARLAAEGKDKLTGASKKQAEQEAVSALIMEQTAKAQGAFASESDTLANKQQILAAKIENIKTKMGSVLLPVLTRLAGFVSDTVIPKMEELGRWFGENILPKVQSLGDTLEATLVPALRSFGDYLTGTVVPAIQDFGTWIQNNRAWLEPLAVAITAMVVAWKVWTTAVAAWTAITKLAAIAQAALNAVLAMNPIGIIVLAIIALVAAFVYLWNTNEGFRNALISAWEAIKGAAMAVWNFLKGFISGAFEFILNAWTKYSPVGIIISNWDKIKAAVSAAVEAIKSWVSKAWNTIKSVSTSVWNAIKSFITGAWNGIKSAVSGAVNSVKSAVSNAWNSVKSATTSAWNSVKSGIQNVWNGIKTATSNAISNVVSTVSGIKGKITGIFSGAASWLLQAGKNILQGLINGITNMIGKVKSKLQGVTNLIPDWKGPAEKDKNLLYKAGNLIMGGLIKGIDDQKKYLRKELGSVTKLISKTDVGDIKGGTIVTEFAAAPKFTTASLLAGGYGTTIQVDVNVPPTADKASIGREIKSALDEWVRVSG